MSETQETVKMELIIDPNDPDMEDLLDMVVDAFVEEIRRRVEERDGTAEKG